MQAIGEQGAVRQSGEAIGVCEIGELLPGVVLLGDVPGEHDNGGFAAERCAFQAQLQIERRIVPSSAGAEVSDGCVFGGRERLDQPIAFGIDHDVREGAAGQRIGGMKHGEECRIGEADPAMAHRGECEHVAADQERTERSWIDGLVVRWVRSFAVAVHDGSLCRDPAIAGRGLRFRIAGLRCRRSPVIASSHRPSGRPARHHGNAQSRAGPAA